MAKHCRSKDFTLIIYHRCLFLLSNFLVEKAIAQAPLPCLITMFGLERIDKVYGSLISFHKLKQKSISSGSFIACTLFWTELWTYSCFLVVAVAKWGRISDALLVQLCEIPRSQTVPMSGTFLVVDCSERNIMRSPFPLSQLLTFDITGIWQVNSVGKMLWKLGVVA